MMLTMAGRVAFLLSLPERAVRPYGAAVTRHFDPERATTNERGIATLRGGR